MRSTPIVIVFTVAVIGIFGQQASANDRSNFRVVGAQLAGDKVELNVAWQHNGSAQPVEFYAHKAIPAHKSDAVRAGLELKKFDMSEGAGRDTFTVGLKALKDKLDVGPGDKLCVAATWPKISSAGHHWGTNMGGQWTKDTAATVPGGTAEQNSRLRRPSSGRTIGRCGARVLKPRLVLKPRRGRGHRWVPKRYRTNGSRLGKGRLPRVRIPRVRISGRPR